MKDLRKTYGNATFFWLSRYAPKNVTFWTYSSGESFYKNETNGRFLLHGAAFSTLISSAWVKVFAQIAQKNNILVSSAYQYSFKGSVNLNIIIRNPNDLLGLNAICESTESLMFRLISASPIRQSLVFNQTSLRL